MDLWVYVGTMPARKTGGKDMGRISVFRRTDGDKDGRAQLYAVVYIDRDKIRITTGIKVLEGEWDAAHERVKGKKAEDFILIIEQPLMWE